MEKQTKEKLKIFTNMVKKVDKNGRVIIVIENNRQKNTVLEDQFHHFHHSGAKFPLLFSLKRNYNEINLKSK